MCGFCLFRNLDDLRNWDCFQLHSCKCLLVELHIHLPLILEYIQAVVLKPSMCIHSTTNRSEGKGHYCLSPFSLSTSKLHHSEDSEVIGWLMISPFNYCISTKSDNLQRNCLQLGCCKVLGDWPPWVAS